MEIHSQRSLVRGFGIGTVLAAFFVSALVASASAQQAKPDFTGTWKINLSKSKFPQQHGPARTGDIYKIKHSGPKLEMEHLFSSRSETYSYVTDGKEHTANRSALDGELRAKAYWDGNVLVIDKSQFTSSGISTWTTRFTLSPDGMALAITQHVAKSLMGNGFDEELIYDKQR
jgi:hypothetical protein